MATPLPCQRGRFFIPEDTHYLNCAYMGPLLRASEEAAIAGLRRKRVPSGITAPDFFELPDRVRSLFARLIGAGDSPERIAIIPAVSYGISTVAANLPVRPGANAVMLWEQYPSNVYAWRRLREDGLELRMVGPAEGVSLEERGPSWNRRLLEAIDRDTVLVTLPPLHWSDGTLFDLEALGERAREVGALFVVDGTQWVGAAPFDVARVRPDALIVAAYKWLLAPYNLAVAYYGPRFDDGRPIEEGWLPRVGSDDFAGLARYNDAFGPGAVRYDMGERTNFISLPALVASLEQILAWTPEAIQAYCRHLTAELFDTLTTRGFRIAPEGHRPAHLVGIRAPEGEGRSLDPETLRRTLEERDVHVSVRGDAVRIAPHLYNDAADVAALLACLEEAAPG